MRVLIMKSISLFLESNLKQKIKNNKTAIAGIGGIVGGATGLHLLSKASDKLKKAEQIEKDTLRKAIRGPRIFSQDGSDSVFSQIRNSTE